VLGQLQAIGTQATDAAAGPQADERQVADTHGVVAQAEDLAVVLLVGVVVAEGEQRPGPAGCQDGLGRLHRLEPALAAAVLDDVAGADDEVRLQLLLDERGRAAQRRAAAGEDTVAEVADLVLVGRKDQVRVAEVDEAHQRLGLGLGLRGSARAGKTWDQHEAGERRNRKSAGTAPVVASEALDHGVTPGFRLTARRARPVGRSCGSRTRARAEVYTKPWAACRVLSL